MLNYRFSVELRVGFIKGMGQGVKGALNLRITQGRWYVPTPLGIHVSQAGQPGLQAFAHRYAFSRMNTDAPPL